MSRFLHGLLHVVGVVAQVVNVAAFPLRIQPVVAGSLAALQAVLALANHPKE